MDKRKLVLYSSIVLLLIGCGYIYYKKSKKNLSNKGTTKDTTIDVSKLVTDGNKGVCYNPNQSVIETINVNESKNTIADDVEVIENASASVSVANANKEVEYTLSTAKVATIPTYQTKVVTKTSTYQSADGEQQGLDLYHRIISICAVMRKDCNAKGASMLKNYALNGGIQGKTYSQICYDAIQKMYADDKDFVSAMELIGSKEQFRKDLYQYLNEGTFRI